MSEGTFGNPESVEYETDVLIIGGGMAACGCAYEAKRWAGDDVKVTLIDKAAMDRSGAVAQGLSAINTYLGENTLEDYCRYVSADLMGITRDHADFTPELKGDINEIAEKIYKPVRTYLEHKDKTTAEDINPHYILPRMFQMRLQKLMDDYVAGIATYYQTNGKLLEMGLHYLTMLKEDSANLRAKDLHELLRAWENYHRVWAAEAHLRHIMFREETRYPGFYYRADYPDLDEDNWKCFVNSRHDPETGERSLTKVPHRELVEKHYG